MASSVEQAGTVRGFSDAPCAVESLARRPRRTMCIGRICILSFLLCPPKKRKEGTGRIKEMKRNTR
jgi:hypothetical protein